MYNVHILYYNDHGYTEYVIENYSDIDSIAYEDALNMGLRFKESCEEWRHRYEELKYGKRSD